MNDRNNPVVQFSETIKELASKQVFQYAAVSVNVTDVAGQVNAVLQRPTDFPPIDAAIIPGDRVALAVDPNIPQLCDVILGAVKTIGATEAGDIDVVLWDEATDATLAAVRDVVGDSATVIRHNSSHRESVRFLGADDDAEPIYVNRAIVDADFVLPIIAHRTEISDETRDSTGIFPAFADSHTRARYRDRGAESSEASSLSDQPHIAWLMGIQFLLCVTANSDGTVASLQAGTPEAIRKATPLSNDQADEFPPRASCVIASLDGRTQQQTWANAVRAIVSASRFVEPNGTIVLWTEIETEPNGYLACVSEIDGYEDLQSDEPLEPRGDTDDFSPWDESVGLASAIARIASEHRIMVHSQIDRETIEPMGLGVVEDVDQLIQLSKSFDSCGVLRAAQYASGIQAGVSSRTRQDV